MKNWFVFLSFATILLLSSCKSKNVVNNDENQENQENQQQQNNKKNLPKDANVLIDEKFDFYQSVLVHPKFDQIKINSRLEIIADTSLPTLDALFYIEDNQKVWVNISFWMMPQVRGIATPEGIKGYLKLEKTYIDSDYEYLNNLLNVNFIDYITLQKILMGRTILQVRDNNFFLTKNMQGYKLVSSSNFKMETENGTREYKIELNYFDNFDLKRMHLQDVNSDDELEISYDNWEKENKIRMPKNVKIIIKGSKNNQILIENTKFEFSKMETPYSVPNRYKKIEIQ